MSAVVRLWVDTGDVVMEIGNVAIWMTPDQARNLISVIESKISAAISMPVAKTVDIEAAPPADLRRAVSLIPGNLKPDDLLAIGKATGPACGFCGNEMQLKGTCWTCQSCGETTGCG